MARRNGALSYRLLGCFVVSNEFFFTFVIISKRAYNCRFLEALVASELALVSVEQSQAQLFIHIYPSQDNSSQTPSGFLAAPPLRVLAIASELNQTPISTATTLGKSIMAQTAATFSTPTNPSVEIEGIYCRGSSSGLANGLIGLLVWKTSRTGLFG